MLATRLGLQSSLTHNAITTLCWMGFFWFTIEWKLGEIHGFKNTWMNNIYIPWIKSLNTDWNFDLFVLKQPPISFLLQWWFWENFGRERFLICSLGCYWILCCLCTFEIPTITVNNYSLMFRKDPCNYYTF